MSFIGRIIKFARILIDTLPVPNSPMGVAVYAVHGIPAAKSSASTTTDAINQLYNKAYALPLSKRCITTFNLSFDQRLITQSLHLEDDSAAT